MYEVDGSYNKQIHKSRMLEIAFQKPLIDLINDAPLFPETKQILVMKVQGYFDHTNVLAKISDAYDPFLDLEIDLTQARCGFTPYDVSQPMLQNIFHQIRSTYKLFMTRAVGGLERQYQSVDSYETSQTNTVRNYEMDGRQPQKKGFLRRG